MEHHPVIGRQPGKEERAVPGMTDLGNVVKHIARYNLALLYAQNKTVLDAACGSGYGSFLLASVANKVIGIDCSSDAIQYAQQHYQHNNSSFLVADVQDMAFEVDLIVSFETVEHIKELDLLGKSIERSLKPGGMLIYSVPLNEEPGFNPYHEHIFNYSSARRIFPNLSLQEELIQNGVNFYPPKNFPLHLQWLAYIGIAKKNS